MPFMKKFRAFLTINEVSDDEEELTEVTPDYGQSQGRGGFQKPTDEEYADMSAVERKNEKEQELQYKKEPSCSDRACFDWKAHLCYVVCIIIFLGLILPVILTQTVFHQKVEVDSSKFCYITTEYRFPCYEGGKVLDQASCEALHCCYDESSMATDQNTPICFHSSPSMYGYNINNTTNNQAMTRKWPSSVKDAETLNANIEELSLTKINDNTPYDTTGYDLQVKVVYISNNALRIQIWNKDESDTTIPETISPPGVLDNRLLEHYITDDEHDNFAITVKRLETNETIFKTIGPLIFGDKYIEIATGLPTRYVYGLGQRGAYYSNPNFDTWEEWSLFNTEVSGSQFPNIRYGSHPFYMCFEESNKVHGVFLKHSGPLDIKVLPTPAVTFRLLTGYIDITIMAGPDPKEVSRQYAEQVKFPAMPPYWALGFHLCRTARNSSLYSNVSQTMEDNGIPYESDCIDAQLNYPDAFAPLDDDTKAMITEMKLKGRKFIMVQYPFVTTSSSVYDPTYMLNFGSVDQPYFGLVNGSAVGYPDYANENTESMLNSIQDLYDLADGFMLLQNTPLNEASVNYTEFNTTLCKEDAPELCCGPNDDTVWPFLPNFIQDLSDNTVCMDVKQSSGDSDSHLPNHNSYGKEHMQTVHNFIKNEIVINRPMITSLSTHPGSNEYGGHFGGSYTPDFVSAKKGLIQVLQMGLVGLTNTGIPTCGSINATTSNLQSDWCLRAYQMNAFFPYMMSYTELEAELRDPASFPPEVIKYLRLVILQRYMLMPYLYTLQWEASTSGVPLNRLLAYEFPEHLGSREVTSQFMVGSSLMVTPVFNSIINLTSIEVEATFPPGCWYDYHTATLVSNSVNGTNMTLPSLLTDINLHVQGGHIIPMQGSTVDNATTTDEFRLLPFKLLVALTCKPPQTPSSEDNLSTDAPEIWNAIAHGTLYLDDGLMYKNTYNFQGLNMSVADNTLIVEKVGDPLLGEPCDDEYNHTITSITIMGADPISEISVDGTSHDNFSQDPDSGRVDITELVYDWCDGEGKLSVTWLYS